MLDEGWRRKERGADVVVGFVETHRRPRTQEQVRDLEVMPRQRMEYRGTVLEEMDVDAVLVRRPAVALVDELAHTNVPGSRREKRWEDVEELLTAGIDVITTVNIQHLESLNDVIEQITGIHQRETVPDAVVRRADQIELVDMSPEALRRRMAHGNIYPAERVDAALANYFRPGNLAALRELALLWVADRVEENLHTYMEAHEITEPWETRERVVVAVTGAPGGDQVVRRAARIAGRLRGGLVGVHVVASDGLETRAGPNLAEQRQLLIELGGTYREIVGDQVASALVDFALSEKATQVAIGATKRNRWYELLHGSVVGRIVSRAEGFDVHVVAQHDDEDEEPPPDRPDAAPAPAGAAPAAQDRGLGPDPRRAARAHRARWRRPARTPSRWRPTCSCSSSRRSASPSWAGCWSASSPPSLASLLANWYFVEPTHTLTISDPENVVAIAIFVAAADRRQRPRRPHPPAQPGGVPGPSRSRCARPHERDPDRRPDPLPELLDQLRTTFTLQSVSLLSNRDDGWVLDASAGDDPPTDPYDGDPWDLVEDGTSVVVLRGAQLSSDDQRVLRTFLSNLALALESRRLEAEAAMAAHLAEADQLRTALLQAVSHDLRTPLASIKASASSILQSDVADTSSIQLGRRGAPCLRPDDRLGRRSAEPPRGQPARHEPRPGRRPRASVSAGLPGGRRRRGARLGRSSARPGGDRCARLPPGRGHGPHPPRASAGARHRQLARLVPARASGAGRGGPRRPSGAPARHRPRAWGRPGATGSGSSSPSSASVIVTAKAESASVWPSRAASSRPSTGPSCSTTRRAGA